MGIAAGNYHSLAVCSDGTLATWGWNADGQLGNDAITQGNAPVAVSNGALPAGARYTAAAAGAYHTLAVAALPPAAANSCGASGTLDGTGSSDPDGDALAYMWNGPFGTVTGVTPTVNLLAGVHTITLTVADGRGGSATDSVLITVGDPNNAMLSGTFTSTTLLTHTRYSHAAARLADGWVLILGGQSQPDGARSFDFKSTIVVWPVSLRRTRSMRPTTLTPLLVGFQEIGVGEDLAALRPSAQRTLPEALPGPFRSLRGGSRWYSRSLALFPGQPSGCPRIAPAWPWPGPGGLGRILWGREGGHRAANGSQRPLAAGRLAARPVGAQSRHRTFLARRMSRMALRATIRKTDLTPRHIGSGNVLGSPPCLLDGDCPRKLQGRGKVRDPIGDTDSEGRVRSAIG